jgi:hypothetical protein
MRVLLCALLPVCAVLALGCKKKAKTTTIPTTSATNRADSAPWAPPQGTNYQPGAGVVHNVASAANRLEVKNDLQQMRIFIENASLASGRMPSAQETYQALKKEAPKIAKLIDDRVITLNAARTREEVWAYETAALQSGGQVLTSQGVEQMDAETLKQRLGLR